MFHLREFIKNGFLKAVGKMPDYWVIMNATGWHEKGVLDEADLAEISAKLEALHSAETAEEAPVE